MHSHFKIPSTEIEWSISIQTRADYPCPFSKVFLTNPFRNSSMHFHTYLQKLGDLKLSHLGNYFFHHVGISFFWAEVGVSEILVSLPDASVPNGGVVNRDISQTWLQTIRLLSHPEV